MTNKHKKMRENKTTKRNAQYTVIGSDIRGTTYCITFEAAIQFARYAIKEKGTSVTIYHLMP